ncbi:MAG: hypothetical protein SFW62_10055 [Alphaproteobacteria bacterium]|nr:hypothetical protein [Alphaproteobacteria bacterium]
MKDKAVVVELSPIAYMALCGLVQDALQHPSDATPLLNRVAQELANATANGMLPSDLLEQPERIEALRRAGMAA